MSVETSLVVNIDSESLNNYLRNLVNRFFKILPIREQDDGSLSTYMRSLQMELLGCKNLIPILGNDASLITLLSILQYLIDNPDSSVTIVRREVFHAISICNKLKATYVK